MCGIVGVFHQTGSAPQPSLIKEMTQVMAYRGPDDEGQFIDGPIGLGHRRLSIIDLSKAGHQPMVDESNNLVITHNGEIYNFKDLREELKKDGVSFKSDTDTEVVLQSYRKWGMDCVNRFNGMFAFSIYDKKKKRLFLSRDRYGIKPLYWIFQKGVFAFASEIKSLLKHPVLSAKVNPQALNEYFTFQNTFTDETLFAGVRLLPPGTNLILDLNEKSKPHLKQYWDFKPSVDQHISEKEAEENLYNIFKEAVKRQLVSDVQVGAYLSGGMDSGSIVAVARQQLGRLVTFTGGFDMSSASGLELGCDERVNSEIMSNLFKTEHYEMVMHAGDMEHVMPELIWHLEDLRVGQCYPNYYVARLASKFVKVTISGAGGDELFAGYPWRYYNGAESSDKADFHQRYYEFWQRLIPDGDKDKFYHNNIYKSLNGHSTFEVFKNVFKNWEGEFKSKVDYVQASLYFELKTFLHGLLVVEDKLSMAHSLETRVPFLDNKIVDFSMKLPVSYKLNKIGKTKMVDENIPGKRSVLHHKTNDGKVILRKSMRRLIPDEITNRIKQGFSAPDASWFRGDSISYINTLLRDPKANLYNYISRAYVENTLDQHCSGKVNKRLLIWSLLSFEWWLRKFNVN